MGHLGEVARILEALTNKDFWEVAGKLFGPLCVLAHLTWQRLRGKRTDGSAEDAALDERFLAGAVYDHDNQQQQIDLLTKERDYFQARWEDEQKQCAYEREGKMAARAELEAANTELDRRNAAWEKYGLLPWTGFAIFDTLYPAELARQRKEEQKTQQAGP